MNWQDIAQRDPYLAGSIAARGWQWWQETTIESEANAISLTGERRAIFFQGWQDELAEQEKERQGQLMRDYDEMAAGYEKGDPAR